MVRNPRASAWAPLAVFAAALFLGIAALASTANTAFCIVPFAMCNTGQHDQGSKDASRGRLDAERRGASIPLPSRALLTPQAQPNCEYRQALGGDDAARAKLDYERQCYRHYEMIARHRLELLQVSVERTIRAVKHAEQQQSQK